jgi:hypothetical protein
MMIISDRVNWEFEYIDPCLCNAWVAAAIIGTGLVSAGVQAYIANKAANAQETASANAANTQLQMYNQTNANLSPFRQAGVDATSKLQAMLPDLTKGVNVDTSILNDPNSTIAQGYKFINSQGQRGVTNSAAARGLATSGAALKGASTFATGSADTFYNNLFNMGVTNQTNAYNRLKGLIDTGENAAAQTGTAATSTGTGIANTQIASGNAAAAGINAAGTAVSNAGNSVGTGLLISGLYGKGNSTSPLFPGSSIPGASGPTSVNGLPLAP